MKQQDVDQAITDVATSDFSRFAELTSVEVAKIVYAFLSSLLPKASFMERMVIKYVRGLVYHWLDKRGSAPS